ncbi:MAG: amino acid transporter [Ilumatobacter sp.]|nr:amino acid transporter [Ilumatobacter sp.]
MAATELGAWEPLPLAAAVELFRDAPLRWWISGGLALELHVGRSWRGHGDTDIGVVRSEAARLRDVLDGWDLHLASGGELTAWDGHPLRAEDAENNVWCRRDTRSPWTLDVTIGDGDRDDWIFRRDPSITLPWADAVLHTDDGAPYVAPEIMLLFKCREPRRAKDDLDAVTVIPMLDADRRARLAGWLPADHPWLPLTEV